MRLIDAEMIKIPTSLIHNINGCFMIRVEDVQRITSDQPTAFDKEKVMDELQNAADLNIGDGLWHVELRDALEIVEKGGIE